MDTSVWVEHLRSGERRLAALLADAEVLTHDFVRGEIACGYLKNQKEILSLLKALPSAQVVTQEELLTFIEAYSLYGSGIGFVDAHLLASAKLASAPLWTFDRQLKELATKLKLSYL